MGLYMSHPNTEKTSRDGTTEQGTAFGLCEMQGWRVSMEDASMATRSAGKEKAVLEIYGVFDGHGGSSVSNWVSRHFVEILNDTIRQVEASGSFCVQDIFEDHDWNKVRYGGLLCESLRKGFLELDNRLTSGSMRDELRTIYEARKPNSSGWPSSQILDMLMQHVRGGSPKNEDDNDDNHDNVIGPSKPDKSNIVEISGDDNDDIWADQGDPSPMDTDPKHTHDITEREITEIDHKLKDDDNIMEISDDSRAVFRLNSTTDANSILHMIHENHHKDDKNNKIIEKDDNHETNKESGKPCTDDIKKGINDGKNNINNKGGEHHDGDGDKKSESISSEENEDDGNDEYTKEWWRSISSGVASKGGDINPADIASKTAQDEQNQDISGQSGGNGNGGTSGQAWQPEYCGSTAVVSVLCHMENEVVLIVANSGDSRAVLCREGVAIDLSVDHKPDNPGENMRICTAGGTVTEGRVDGNLNLSRAIGDLVYKQNKMLPQEEQKISAYPDIKYVKLSAKDEFLILACDGIWDCDTSQGIVNRVRRKIRDGDTPRLDVKLSDVVGELLDNLVSKSPIQDEGVGCDNMTCIIIDLARLKNKTKGPQPVLEYPTPPI